MVDQRKALISSTLTSIFVTLAHGAGHYFFGNPESFAAAGVSEVGAVVFAATFLISYAGMQDLLPF